MEDIAQLLMEALANEYGMNAPQAYENTEGDLSVKIRRVVEGPTGMLLRVDNLSLEDFENAVIINPQESEPERGLADFPMK